MLAGATGVGKTNFIQNLMNPTNSPKKLTSSTAVQLYNKELIFNEKKVSVQIYDTGQYFSLFSFFCNFQKSEQRR